MKHWGWPGVWLAHTHGMVPDFTCQAVLTIGIVLQARSRLCNDKGSGDDGVVTELLKAIPPLLVYNVWWWFCARLEGWTHCPGSWKKILAVWLKKVARANMFSHMRGVCLLSTVSKWFMACCMMIGNDIAKPLTWTYVCNFGFEPGRQILDIIGNLNILSAHTLHRTLILFSDTSPQDLRRRPYRRPYPGGQQFMGTTGTFVSSGIDILCAHRGEMQE